MNFKQFLDFDDSYKNIQIFVDNAFMSTFASNILVPSILFYVTCPSTNRFSLFLWYGASLTLFFLRVGIIQKLKYFLKHSTVKTPEIKKHFYMLLSTIFINTFLNLYLIINNIAEGTSYLNIFIFSTIITTLTSGAIGTLLSVFKVYLTFVLINMSLFIAALLFYAGEDFFLFSILLIIFTIINIRIAYNQHKLLSKISSLKDTFQTIYESSSDSILLIENNRFKDCNNAMVQLFQFDSKEDLLAQHISTIMPRYQEDGTLSIKKMLQIVKIAYERGHLTFEWQHIKKNGKVFWVECSLTKIYVDDKELLHAVYRDITQRKKLEKEKEAFQETLIKQVAIEVEKNRKKDKMIMYQSRLAQMGEMISMIAHQWLQPLNAITIATGVINLKASRNQLDTKTALEISNNITKFAMHLSATIDDFRNFFQTNKIKTTTNYQQMVESVLLIIESSLINHNITMNVDVRNLKQLHTYENEIKQVLLNLIKNAEDILREKEIKNPTITVIIDNYTLSVSDNAGGVPPELIEKIFDPYFSTKTKKDGTGLGLYMSKMIVEDHCGGTLSVHNNQEGATFTIILEEEQNV